MESVIQVNGIVRSVTSKKVSKVNKLSFDTRKMVFLFFIEVLSSLL